jgi:enoyl-CoA hydratase
MSELVSITEEADYCLIKMDDGKANALSFDMLAALNERLDRAAALDRVGVLAGRPGKFSAGFDLAVMNQGGEGMLRILQEGAALSRRLLDFETPVVAAVSGHALAMGALLALSCDYRIGMLGDYKIGLNEVAIGLPLPYFAVELARARLSTTHLDRATGLARTYDAAGAVEAGYLDEAAEGEGLLPRATAVAKQLATLDAEAHRITKSRVREPLRAALQTAIDREFPS